MRFDVLVKRYFAGVILILSAVVAYLHATVFGQIVRWKLTADISLAAPIPMASAAAPWPPAADDHATSARAILDRNPFDSVTPRPLDAAPDAGGGEPAIVDLEHSETAPPCDGMKVLIVVSSPTDPDWSMAALSSGGAPTKLARKGDEVGGKTVQIIDWNRVVLSSGSSLCQLQMFRPSTAPAPTGSATAARPPEAGTARGSAVPPAIASKIQKVSDAEYNIDKQVVDTILEDQAELFKGIRIVPEKDNGKSVGIRLFGIRDDSVAGLLGLKNGDRLQSINGFDMGSPEKALEAYAVLRRADHLTMQVNRAGKEVNVDLNIK
jgi:general secretion pathway protein C